VAVIGRAPVPVDELEADPVARHGRSRALLDGVTVVVPVYRSELILPELHRRLTVALQEVGEPYEIVLVEDAGGDGSWSVIEGLARQDAHVRGFRMSRNFGQHNALLAGIREARFATTVTIDDDLQNPPEEIPKLLARLDDRTDVVYGTPDHEQHGFLRDQASHITKISLQSVMGSETARHVSAFRAFRTNVRDAFESYRGPFVTIDVLLTWGTTRFSHVTVRHDERASGRSNYTVRALIAHAFNMMTGFTTLPLQVASIIGFAFTMFGLVVLAYVIGSFVVNGGSAVPGFAFLASIVAIFSGAQLFALGIIGEYLARIHFRIMDRPSYVVRDLTDDADDR
jgi:undecaprenyl-phosphate 4-deoxy-4-formamido-L-arabinose transferase